MDIGKIEQLTTYPMTADEWMRQRVWAQLPQRGLFAEELNRLREFLTTKGLWDEYQAWARRTMTKHTEFNHLARVWVDGRVWHSRSDLMLQHPACRQIVAMGPEVVPWCLARLAQGEMPLAWARLLEELTGEHPAPPPEAIAGGHIVAYDVEATAQAWIQWGKARGFLPSGSGD